MEDLLDQKLNVKERILEILQLDLERTFYTQASDGKLYGFLDLNEATGLPYLRQDQWLEINQQAVYTFTVLYLYRSPHNRFYQNSQLLDAAIKGIHVLLEQPSIQKKYDCYDFVALTMIDIYELLKVFVSREIRTFWQEGLMQMAKLCLSELTRSRGNINFTIEPQSGIGWGLNHQANAMLALYRAGQLFHKPGWKRLAENELERIVDWQNSDGYWSEYNGPTLGYNLVTLENIARYAFYSRSKKAWASVKRGVRLHLNTLYPNGYTMAALDNRVPHGGIKPVFFPFLFSPAGRGYIDFVTKKLLEIKRHNIKHPGDHDLIGYESYHYGYHHLALTLRHWHGGKISPLPLEKKNYTFTFQRPCKVLKRGPWIIILNGFISIPYDACRHVLDWQSHLTVYHEKTGLIIGEGGSKRQPENSSFVILRQGKDQFYQGKAYLVDWGAELFSEQGWEKLRLSYHYFPESQASGALCTLGVKMISPAVLKIEMRFEKASHVSGVSAQLPLYLKIGEKIRVGNQFSTHFSARRVKLKFKRKTTIHHQRWRLSMPAESEIRWPIFPFNPYRINGRTAVYRGRGLVRTELKREGERAEFIIKIK